MYLQTDLKSFDFSSLGVKFDVLLLEPPLEEYQRRASGVNFSWSPWEWEEVRGREGELKVFSYLFRINEVPLSVEGLCNCLFAKTCE